MRAMLWEILPNGAIQCRLCAHRCRLKKGDKGRCGVRISTGNELTSLVGNVVSCAHMDPVEKKPLYHFLPGSKTFSIGSVGCNFTCSFCQNHSISQIPGTGVVPGKRVSPEELARLAEEQNVPSMAFTYNEPTIFFELVYETAAIAQISGIRSILVSNGYMSADCLQALSQRVSAINVDLKSFSEAFYSRYCEARLQPVLDNLKYIKSMGWWLEVTTLVIPGLNDSDAELKEIAAFIHGELGENTPWHLSAFHGAHKMANHPATPLALLEKGWQIGREAGLNFVYIGNLSSAIGGNTFCPSCGALVIERQGYEIRRTGPPGRCPSCSFELPGVWV
jgi:pyruvate formate lyase activating enzyme